MATGTPLSLDDIIPNEAAIVEMTQDDLGLIQTLGPAGPAEIQGTRERHHCYARLFALGETNSEIARLYNTSSQHLSSLKRSPLFQDLIELYRDKFTRKLFRDDIAKRVKVVSVEYLEELHHRLAAQQDEIPFKHLSDTTMALLDRAEVGSTHRHEHTHRMGLTEEELDALKQAAREGVYESEAVDVTPDRGSDPSGDESDRPLQIAQGAEGSESEGPGV